MDDDSRTVAGSDGVSVHSGFPNPALERRGQDGLALNLNSLLVQHPSSTYLFRVAGHRWSDEGLRDGDIAIIDRSLRRRPGDLIADWQDDSFVIRRWHPEDEAGWGVLTSVIHTYRPKGHVA